MSVITRTTAPASLEPSEEIVTALQPSGTVEPGRELSAQDPDLGASTVEYAIILLVVIPWRTAARGPGQEPTPHARRSPSDPGR